MKKLTKEIILERFLAVHGSNFDYSQFDIYNHIDDEVTVICRKHGPFKITSYSHIRGRGCPNISCRVLKTKKTKLDRYGDENYNNIKKNKKTKLDRYGDENYNNRDRYKQTNLEKYGVDNPSKLELVKRMIGKANSINSESRNRRRIETNLEKYGQIVVRYSDTESKRAKTNLEKYGVRSPAQRPEIFALIIQNNKKFKWHDFRFPTGEKIKVQGYEGRVLHELVNSGYNFFDFDFQNRPTIKYFWPMDIGGDDKEHIYYPDIFIPKENKIIEVKSKWTYDNLGKNEKLLNLNFCKREACLEQGYNFEFVIL